MVRSADASGAEGCNALSSASIRRSLQRRNLSKDEQILLLSQCLAKAGVCSATIDAQAHRVVFDRAVATYPLGTPAKFDDAVRENALLLVSRFAGARARVA